MSFNKPKILRIESINQETRKIKSFRFSSQEITREAKPGQFLMLWPIDYKDEVPIAIASVDSKRFEVAVTVVGDCTRALHEKKKDDFIGIRGPYGHGFSFSGNRFLFVGGGYGNAPLRFAAEYAINLGKYVTVALGAKSEQELLYRDNFEQLGCNVHIATDDGSCGYKGPVTDIVLELIRAERFDSILMCGPELMMYKIILEAKKYGIPTQVSVERIVKCGVGVCGSCDCGGYRICRDGPVISGEDLIKTEFGKWKRDRTGARIPFGKSSIIVALKPLIPNKEPMLELCIAGTTFPNTVMNASGSGFSSALLYRYAKAGAGAIVTKSIGLNPRKGYNGPNFIEESPGTWNNSMGLPNPGIENYRVELKELKTALKVPIILSIFGHTPEQCARVALRGINYGANFIEINMSCPHTEISSVEKDSDLVKEITHKVKRTVNRAKGRKRVPVSVKISPNVDYVEVAKAAVEGGADAIVATNTLRVKPILHTNNGLVPVLGNPSGYGGMSGRKLAELSKRALIEIYSEVNVPIFSVGGIDPTNIVDRVLSGASAFQLATALVYFEIEDLFERCKQQLKDYIKSNGYENIKEIVGIGLKK